MYKRTMCIGELLSEGVEVEAVRGHVGGRDACPKTCDRELLSAVVVGGWKGVVFERFVAEKMVRTPIITLILLQ